MENLLKTTRAIDNYVYTNISKLGEIKELWNMPIEVLGGAKIGSLALIITGAVVAACISKNNGKLSRSINRICDNYPSASKIVIVLGSIILYLIIAL